MRWPYILSLLALLGAGLLLFFNILCGASTSSVLGQFYWLQADTSGISGAHPTTRWTNYDSCGVRNGRNYDCSSKQAGYPMSPRANFGQSSGIPSGLSSRKGITYYLSRVGWAFLLLGLLFTILALLPVAVSFCIPGLSILGIGSNFATNAALLFTVLSACLLTAAYVKARNAFRSDGRQTSLGKKMFAFIWTSVFLLFLSSLFSGVGCIGSMFGKRREKKRYSDNYDSSSHETYGNNYVQEKRNDPEQGRGGFFSRKNRQNENLEDVGYAAGLGAAGVGTGAAAAGGNTRGATSTGDAVTRNPQTGETLDDVAYAAGYGASGATTDITQEPQQAHTKGSSGLGTTAAGVGAAGVGAAALGHHQSKKNDTIPEANENEYSSYGTGKGSAGADTGYQTGAYGSSGKTRDLTGNTSGTYGSSNKHPDQMYGAGVGENEYYHPDSGAAGTYNEASKPYDTGAATGYGSKSTQPAQAGSYGDADTTSSSNKGLWGAAAAALGLGGAAAAANHKDTDQTDNYGSNSAYGRDTTTGTIPDESSGGVGTTGRGVSDSTTGKTSAQYGDSTGYGNDYQDQTNYGSKSGSGYGTTAAGAATGAGLASASRKDTKPVSGAATHGPGYYSANGTDTGEGATHAGANAEKINKSREQYENKSTALPVGASHYNKDSYGNETPGYDTGVPSDGAASAASAAAAGGSGVAGVPTSNYYRTSKEGAAVRPEDTYNNLYANSKDNNDVTDTTGYEPTSYYSRKTGEEFNTGKERTTDASTGDKVYGTSASGDYGPSSGRTGAAADDTTTSDAAKGGFFGAFLGRGNRKSKTFDDDSNLAKRNSTSSSVYDTQVPETSSNSNRGGAYDTSSRGARGDTTTTAPTSKTGYGDDYNNTSGQNKKSSGIDKNAALGAGAIGAGAAATYGAGKTGHKDELNQAKGVYDKHGDKLNDAINGQGKYGSSSATRDATYDSSSKPTSKSTSRQAEDLKDVGYSAGYGASGATSSTRDSSKPYSKTTDKSSSAKKSTSGQGEDLNDVAYAAGFGASGATADKSKLHKSHGGHGITGAERESGLSSKDTSGARNQNKYGQDYTSSTGKGSSTTRSGDKDDIAASAAAALGLGSAAGAAGSSKKDSGYDSKYHGSSNQKENIYDAKGDKYSSSGNTGVSSSDKYGSKSSGYGKYDTDTSEVNPAVDPSRNRNPIAEGLTGSTSGKPTTGGNTSIPSAGRGSGARDVSGVSGKDQSNTYGSTGIGSGRTGPSTGEKLESGVTGKERSYDYGSRAADISSRNHGLSTGEKLNDSTSGTTKGKGSYAQAAAAGGLGSAGASSRKYDSSSRGGVSSNTKGTGYGSSAGRYEGEDYYDDSVPGTFPNDQVSSPTQKAVDTSGDGHYTTRSGYGNTSEETKATPRSSVQGQQYDAQGNPIKKEGILDVIVDTAKSVI